jgi:hypothetical protein
MNREPLYRSITYIGGLFLIIGVFANPEKENVKAIYEIIYDLVAMTVYAFAFMWLRKRILLIGMGIYAVVWNIDIITNPFFQIPEFPLNQITLMKIGIGFAVVAFAFLLLGLWDGFKQKYLIQILYVKLFNVLLGIVVFTAVVQVLLRI